MNKHSQFVMLFLLLNFLLIQKINAEDNPRLLAEYEVLANMELMAENHSFQLFYNKKDCSVAVFNITSGNLWLSNPPIIEGDILKGNHRDYAKSQVVIDYIHKKREIRRLNSYKHSVITKQFSLKKLQNGFEVSYVLGDKSYVQFDFPPMISKKRMEEAILPKISEKDKNFLILGEPDLGIKGMYGFDEKIKAYFLYAHRSGGLVKLSGINLKKLGRIFYEIAGYTELDLINDRMEFGIIVEDPRANFSLTIVYILENDSLKVTVPYDRIKYKPSAPIEKITLLEYFYAAGKDAKGYMVIPDGSGALINLNSNKINQIAYQGAYYGEDLTQLTIFKENYTLPLALPVFGMSQEQGTQNRQALFSVIEQGAETAILKADISKKTNSFNHLGPIFYYRNRGQTFFRGAGISTKVNLFNDRDYDKDIVIRYFFLENDKADYPGMAALYSDYLIENNQMITHETLEQPSLFLDLLGSFYKKDHFLGIPYKKIQSATTFEQAMRILNILEENNIHNIVLKYLGWFNSGINHYLPKTLSVDSIIGGEHGYNEFIGQLNDTEILDRIILSNATNFILFYPRFNSNTFFENHNVARNIEGKFANYHPYHRASLKQFFDPTRLSFNILAPEKLTSTVNAFTKNFQKFHTNLYLTDLASLLVSDFRRNQEYHRGMTLDIVIESLKILHTEFNLNAAFPNSYALKYLKKVDNLPMYHSKMNILDEAIPFYQMVIRGHLEYAGDPVNLSPFKDKRSYFLHSLEYGSSLHFMWSYEPSFIFNNSEFNEYLSTGYELLLDSTIAMFKEYSNYFSLVGNNKIIDHQIIDSNIRKTTFSNGSSIIINYNSYAISIDGFNIQAEDYVLLDSDGNKL